MNPYDTYIKSFFTRNLELRHFAQHVCNTLDNSIEKYETFKAKTEIDSYSSSALVISDWSSSTDNFYTEY